MILISSEIGQQLDANRRDMAIFTNCCVTDVDCDMEIAALNPITCHACFCLDFTNHTG